MIAGIVLAAGESRRAGFLKPLARLDGEPLVIRIVHTLQRAGCEPIVVVVAPGGALDEVLDETGASIVVNPDPTRGMTSSMAIGMHAAKTIEADAAIVALVDHPRVAATTVRALIAARSSGASVARPRYRGRRGHPFMVGAELFDAVANAPPDQGARAVLRSAPNQVDVDVDDERCLEDLDTAEALADAGIEPPE